MEIRTERLIIRPWREEDVKHYLAMSVDVGYNCFTPPGVYLVKDEADALEKVRTRMKIFSDFAIGKFPIFLKETGEFIGTCGADKFELDGKLEYELGYRLMLNHWNKGYATEAARAVLNYLLKDLQLPQLHAFAVYQNPGSLRVIEKVGFTYLRDFQWCNITHRLYVKSYS